MHDKIGASKIIFFLSLSFVLGIFFAPISILIGFFLVGFLSLFLKETLFVLSCTFFFLAGSFYFLYSFYSIPGIIETPVSGMIIQNPVIQENSTKIIFRHEKGKAILYADHQKELDYGDILVVEGNFIKPTPKGYANYLKKEGIYHLSYYPEIKKIGNEKNFFYERIYLLREKLQENLRKSVRAPEVFLLEAVVLGKRDSFSDNLNEMLSISGTRHITAISGMHIVIISSLLFFLLTFFLLSRKKAVILSLLFIGFFIIFVGAPVSAIRAGIMGGLLLLSYFFYRQVFSFNLIIFAATILLLFNPFLLHFDLGFQLSFLAVCGIFFLYLPIKDFLSGKGGDNVKTEKRDGFRKFFHRHEKVTDILSITLSAQIFVFPLILYNFGHISLFSVFMNIIIVPLLPLILVLGFLTAISGLSIFAIPAYLVLRAFLFLIERASTLPFSAIYIEDVSVLFVFLIYLLIFYLIFKKNRERPFHKK